MVDEGDSICSCGASVGGFSSGTENFENEISELYRQAHVFRDKGNYYDAIKLYEEIIDEIDRRNFRDKGNYYDAIKLYEEIIDEIDRRNLNDCGDAWFFRPKAEKELEEIRKRAKL